jgi:hypothetical protein
MKVAAVNSDGRGPWSDASIPSLTMTVKKGPIMPPLVHFKSLDQVITDNMQLIELSEMKSQIEEKRMILSKADPNSTVALNPTNLTPRDINGVQIKGMTKGRVLPKEINPRLGWKSEGANQLMFQNMEESLNKPGILRASKIRILDDGYQNILSTQDGLKSVFVDSVSDSLSGKIACYDVFDENMLLENGEDQLQNDIGLSPSTSMIDIYDDNEITMSLQDIKHDHLAEASIFSNTSAFDKSDVLNDSIGSVSFSKFSSIISASIATQAISPTNIITARLSSPETVNSEGMEEHFNV